MKELSLKQMENVNGEASAAAWGCNLSIAAIGGVWSIAIGSISMGAGFLVGMAYTAMAVQVCDGL